MKRVLFISSRPIYPIVSGIQIRTAQQLEFLTQRYEVDVIYQSGGSGVEDAISGHLPHVGKVIRFVQPAWKRYLRTLRFLFNDLPLQVNYYYQKEIQAYIDAHLNEYDIIFCNNIRTAEYVIRVKNVIKYMDFVDAISMNYVPEKFRNAPWMNTGHGIRIYENDGELACYIAAYGEMHKRKMEKILDDFP